MAIVFTKTIAITNDDALPRQANVSVTDGGVVKESVGTMELSATDSIASILRFIRVRSSTRMTALRVYNDAITTAAGDIGLYRIAADGGAVVDVDFFGSAVAFTSASLIGADVLYEANAGPADVANIEKRIWQQLGLTADPGVQYDIAVTLTTAATGAGTLSLKANFVD